MSLERPFYSSFAWAYDLIINAPVGPRVDFLERAIANSNLIAPIHILDAGCGTGSYAIELALRGYKVTGVDLSTDQIKQALAKSKAIDVNITFLKDDLLKLEYPNKYALILCRGLLNDFLLDQERSDIFMTFAKVVKPGSLLIFDVRDWQGSVRQKADNPVTTKEIDTERGLLKFISNTELDEKKHMLIIHEKHILTTSEGIDEYDWNLKMRCWTIDEVTFYLKQAGFEIVNQYGDYNEKIHLGNSERIVTIATKN